MCDIIDEDIQNTSDHLPIAISIRDDDMIPQERKEENRAFKPWEKIDDSIIQQRYTNVVENMLEKLYDN